MNCSFKILWFEDEIIWYRMQEKHINRILQRYCLTIDVDRRTGEDFDISSLNGNKYDLILMDYKLADTTGDKIISAIRSSDILTDILFYSSQYEKMLKVIHQSESPVDGIFYSDRKKEVFEDKIERVIKKIVGRSEDLINLRGVVLDNSCDFEVRTKEILNLCWSKFDDDDKDYLDNEIKTLIENNKKRTYKQCEEILEENPLFPSANNHKYLLSHSSRLNLVNKIIKILCDKYGFKPKPEHINFKAEYEDKIIVYRNALGHRKSNEDSINIKGKEVKMNEELHRVMRKNLLLYDERIKDIEEFVSENI